jgi:hypothetical protein
MRAIAEAMYAVSYLEWALLGDLPRLTDPPQELSIEGLSRSSMGQVAAAVRRGATSATDSAERAWLDAAADALAEVVERRNQVVHAHPATVGGEQVLYRWATGTQTKPHEAEAITRRDLEALRDLAYEHLRRMNALRLPG